MSERKIKTGDTVRIEGFEGRVINIMGVGEKGVRVFLVENGEDRRTVYERDCERLPAAPGDARTDEEWVREQRPGAACEAEEGSSFWCVITDENSVVIGRGNGAAAAWRKAAKNLGRPAPAADAVAQSGPGAGEQAPCGVAPPSLHGYSCHRPKGHDGEHYSNDLWYQAAPAPGDAAVISVDATRDALRHAQREIDRLKRNNHGLVEERGKLDAMHAEQIAEMQRERDEAKALSDRSISRLVELSEPGSIGAFGARDMAIERAESAERALADEKQRGEQMRVALTELLEYAWPDNPEMGSRVVRDALALAQEGVHGPTA